MRLKDRKRKLEFAKLAHEIKPSVPISWLWLLEWASGVTIFHAKEPK
jgi:hypothetical protein